jgi:hypothetical protein
MVLQSIKDLLFPVRAMGEWTKDCVVKDGRRTKLAMGRLPGRFLRTSHGEEKIGSAITEADG